MQHVPYLRKGKWIFWPSNNEPCPIKPAMVHNIRAAIQLQTMPMVSGAQKRKPLYSNIPEISNI